MLSASKPSWQQVTALVSLSASGTVTGFSFVPHSPADLMSPTSMPVRLMALERSVKPAASGDAALRSAIVNVANYYLRMADGKTPAEMEAIIWQHDSVNGVDHGESCAAFASLTLELAAHVVGQQSWVTGGTSYPWPLQKWADVRVDPNPSSPNIISVLQDAEAHGRWHPLGDGYQPQPGDWVLFDNHVEVVTKYADGTLYTIGGDSLPNFSVNAHEYPAPLSGDGAVGFVNNGDVPAAAATAGSGAGIAGAANSSGGGTASTSGTAATATSSGAPATSGGIAGGAVVPGATSASVSGQTSTSIPGITSTTGRDSRHAPAPGHRAGHPATAASADDSRALPTVPGVATPASTASASDDPAVPGTARSMIPVDSTHIAHQTHRDHGPTRSQTPGRHGATPVRHPAAPVRQGATPPRQAHAGHGTRPKAPAAEIADVPGMAGLSESATKAQASTSGSAAIPGVAEHQPTASAPYRRHQPTQVTAPVQGTSSQQAFIDEIAPGAIATQQKYGVPAAVTIAQAIDESGWGQSQLATQDNNLFGIKGAGPAGSDSKPTQEYENGQWVTINTGFRVYDNVAQSIDDHGALLATSGYYTRAMADRNNPDAFAKALTGVYATNPSYGSDLIQLMQQYRLYRYDASGTGAGATHAGAPAKATAKPDKPTQPSLPGIMPTASASPTTTPAPAHSASPSPAPTPTATTYPTPEPTPTGTAGSTPAPSGTAGPRPISRPSAPGHSTPAPTPTPTRSAPVRARPTPAPTPTPTPSTRAAATPAPTPTPTRSMRDAATPAPTPTPTRSASATARPTPAPTPTPTRSTRAAAAPAPTPRIPGLGSPAPSTSAPQPGTSRMAQPRTPGKSRARAARTPEPLASRTDDAGWAAGSGIAMAAMTEVRRRTKRAQRGNAVDPDDQPVSTSVSSTLTSFVDRPQPSAQRWPADPDPDRAPARRYQHRLPTSVKNDFVGMARGPLLHGELLYRDIADSVGLSWELLAACDWMQCQARPRYSPVHGEKLGARNQDGSVYWSRSEALGQCAVELVYLADAVYGIDLTTELQLSVADLARVFAAFRWGALLKRHRTSAMEFPYSVAGLTVQHMNMRWPNIGDPNTPDKPGARFRKPFGAVPIVLSLHYPATV
jgi:flagellum-specific peptidoglycan hydrolase FlgJ